MYFSPFCQIPLKKFVLSVQQFSKSDTQSISWKRLIFIQFQKAYLCTNIPLACAIARKHHTLTSVLPIFVFVAVLDVSCFPKDKIQLEASWFDQLTSKLFCFTMIIIPPPPPPRIYVLSLWPHPKSVMKLYKPRAYSRNFTVFNLCFTVALQWLTT